LSLLVKEFQNQSTFGELRARKLIVSHAVCLGTVLLKDEELARDLEYGKKQLSLAVVTSFFYLA